MGQLLPADRPAVPALRGAIEQPAWEKYWSYRNTQPNPAVYSGTFNVRILGDELTAVRAQLSTQGLTNAAIDATVHVLEAERTAEYRALARALHARAGPARPGVPELLHAGPVPQFTYELSAAENQRIDVGTKRWTEDELLNLLSRGVLKEVTDTEVAVENPNIIADDVTVMAGGIGDNGQIGRSTGSRTILLDGTPFSADDRELLGSAERGDVAYLRGRPVDMTLQYLPPTIRPPQNGGTLTRRTGSWFSLGGLVGHDLHRLPHRQRPVPRPLPRAVADRLGADLPLRRPRPDRRWRHDQRPVRPPRRPRHDHPPARLLRAGLHPQDQDLPQQHLRPLRQ